MDNHLIPPRTPHLALGEGHFSPYDGFTLIELLLAISIFSIIAVVAYAGLNTALDNQQRASQYAQRTAELQRAVQYLQKDILQMVNRPIRNRWGENQAALVGETQQLTFTHNGGAKYGLLLGQKRSQLQRVSYKIQQQTLIRDYWLALDPAPHSEAISQPLLTDINQLSLRYLDSKHQWHKTWIQSGLPLAIEIRLQLNDIGKVIRLFELSDALRYPAIIKTPQPDAETEQTDEN